MKSKIAFVALLSLGCVLQEARAFSNVLPRASLPRRLGGSSLRVASSDRFDRAASRSAETDLPCLLTIKGKQYDLTAWAKAHPGGVKVLQKFHNKDATRAFDAVGHSKMAYEMLKDFKVPSSTHDDDTINDEVTVGNIMDDPSPQVITKKPRWRAKLFTREDPIGIHK